MLARVEFEGEDRARHAYAQGKGVLFFTGHFGYWELHALVHALRLRPIGVLARALDNPALNQLLEEVRSATGNSVIYRQGAVRRVLKTLAAGEGVALLIDQHMHSPDAIWVSFFGRAAATTSTLAALALRTGAPVVPVFAVPLEWRTISHDLRACRPPAGCRRRQRRFASSRSAVPMCSRCTCGGGRICGCGCIAAGGTFPARETRPPRTQRSAGTPIPRATDEAIMREFTSHDAGAAAAGHCCAELAG